MSRTDAERIADVRRLLSAARRVHDERDELVPQLVASTGLSRQGVELGFESLELDATDAELASLVAVAGTARHVHVVLSANVFVAALRALALARAAAPRVTIRPSTRDPVLARALVEAAGDPDLTLTQDRDASSSGADAVHVYGRDETIRQVRAQVGPQVGVVGHGAGLGIALVTHRADLELAARRLARDVVTFDQRGCLSPRVAFVEGDTTRTRAFARAIHDALAELETSVPRGTLAGSEGVDAVRWLDALAFAGELWTGTAHAVGFAPEAPSLAVPPSGRHLLVVAAPDLAHARRAIEPVAALVVSVGSDDPARAAAVAPSHARTAELGRMQRPLLDGPVDRRTAHRAGAVT